MFVEKKFILCKPKFPKRFQKLRKILNKVREANLPMNQFPEVNPRGGGGGVGGGGWVVWGQIDFAHRNFLFFSRISILGLSNWCSVIREPLSGVRAGAADSAACSFVAYFLAIGRI